MHFAKRAEAWITALVYEAISKRRGAVAGRWMRNRWKTMADGKFDFGFAVDCRCARTWAWCWTRPADQRRAPGGHRPGRPVLRRQRSSRHGAAGAGTLSSLAARLRSGP